MTTPTGPDVIRNSLPLAPMKPGVYLMRDAKGRIIYVGKAKKLRNRLASYARPQETPGFHRQKVEAMVAKVAKVEFVVTATEKEALLLEHTLIKEHRPRYNVDLRDDKSYPYFRLGLDEEYPRFSLVRRPDTGDGARYFGPFDDTGSARRTMRMLQRIFPLRRCSDHTLRTRPRPCLDHETGRCLGPCTGKVTPAEYQALARQLTDFFSGKGEELIGELTERMRRASEDRRYEAAAVYRDRVQALSKTLEHQRVSRAEGRDVDAVALAETGTGLALAVLKARGGRVVAGRTHDLSHAAQTPEEVMAQALVALYQEAAPPPPLVLVSHMPGDPHLVSEILGERAGRRVEIRKPQRGEKRGLLDLALMNAREPRVDESGRRREVLERLGSKLSLPGPPERMECADISHLGGRLTVASVVAFREGQPDKSGYRHYKVLGLEEAPDDYAAMSQIVERRLTGGDPPPDLLVVDGGKGQLAVAQAVLENLPPERRPALAALAKGRAQGEPDRVFLPGRKNPLALTARDPALLLLMRLRDEAHRFAITYHRLLRKKSLTRSVLDEVPGVGPKKKAKLLKAFGSLAALREASAGEMAQRAGVDMTTAGQVADFLAALASPAREENGEAHGE